MTKAIAVAFENSDLLRATLGSDSPEYAHERQILRAAYFDLRQGVSYLVDKIPESCPGLTVHDVTHLDALWGIASMILGSDVEFNPAEAFVFGAALLLHDAALTVAAYDGGLKALEQTDEWRDAIATAQGGADYASKTLSDKARASAIFEVLRRNHAQQAERLLTMTFNYDDDKAPISLIHSAELRDAYSFSIGRVAHSHHWDASKVAQEFETNLGRAINMPQEWTIDEVKIALLLRCADAAHIDRRRAPSMALAISDIEGNSKDHWQFQNRLNLPSVVDDKLLYSSGSPFPEDSAAAWWLCFETTKMIDRELRAAHAILRNLGDAPFLVQGVQNVESAELFAKSVKTAGWEPISAEVRVSDPVTLAKTLGGGNLYGNDHTAPIREIVQNAVDAVKARRNLEKRPEGWGSVKISAVKTADDRWVLNIDDNGVGMSKQVMTGPLIDFGRSFWRSSLMKDEFPGLASSGHAPIGKFGIGFFSVFLLGDEVSVISRRYDRALDDVHILKFERLSRRPILKRGKSQDLPMDVSTRVSIGLSSGSTLAESQFTNAATDKKWYPGVMDRIRRMITALDVHVSYTGFSASAAWEHDPDWVNVGSGAFLADFLADLEPERRSKLVLETADRVQCITNAFGRVIARAAFRYPGEPYSPRNIAVSVGGFGAQPGDSKKAAIIPAAAIGVFVGDTADVSRKTAEPIIELDDIKKWLGAQAEAIAPTLPKYSDQIKFSHAVIGAGGDPGTLPVAFLGGKFVDLQGLRTFLKTSDEILIPVSNPFDASIRVMPVMKLSPDYFVTTPVENIIVVVVESEYTDVLDEKEARPYLEDGMSEVPSDELSKVVRAATMPWFVRLLNAEWTAFVGKIERSNIRPPDAPYAVHHLCLRLSRISTL